MTPLILLDTATKAAEMAQKDPHGWILAVVCIAVVFTALITLFICYTVVGRINMRIESRKAESAVKEAPAVENAEEDDSDMIAAAIAVALNDYLCDDVHDEESYVLTINRQ